MTITKRAFLKLSCAGLVAATPMPVFAQEWRPRRPIDFVIMAGPGGGADQIARFIQSVAEKMDLSPRPLVPNNKGGGSGAEALLHVSGAGDADHTILVTLNSFFTTPLRQADLGIDVQTYTPIAMMGVDPFVLWVNAKSGITTLDQFLEKVRSMDGEFVMGGTGTGQEDSIVIAAMSKAFDLKVKYIPYDGGGAVARDLAGQQVMATVNNPAEAKGFFTAGEFVPLMVFSAERMEAYPDVPTMRELGHDFTYYNQRAVVGAPGMSEGAAEFYRAMFTSIYDSPDWQGYLASESLSPLWMSEEETRAYWAKEVESHRTLLASLES